MVDRSVVAMQIRLIVLTSLTDSVHRRPQIFSKSLVERKRLGRTLPAVINGLSASQARADGLVEDPTTTPTDVTDGNKKDKALFLSDESDEESANPKVSSITVSNGREPHFADTASVNPFKKLASLNETPGPSPFAKPSLIDIKESNSILPRLETVPKFNFFSPTLSTSSENTKPTVASSNVPSQPSSIWGQSSLSSSSSSGGFIWPSIPSSSIINTYVSDNLSKTPPASTNLQNLSGSSTSPSTTTTTAVMPSSILLPPTKPDRTSVNSQDNIIQPVKHFSSSLSPSALNIFPSGNNLHTSTSNDSTKPLFSVQQQVHPKDTPTIVQVPEPANSGLAYSTQPSVPETYRPLETPKGISTASGLSLTQSPTLTPPANINNLLPKAPLNHQNELMTPKIDPRPKLLDQLTSTLVRQNDGLLQQFIEYTVGPIVLKAMNQIKAERSREEAGQWLPGKNLLDRKTTNIIQREDDGFYFKLNTSKNGKTIPGSDVSYVRAKNDGKNLHNQCRPLRKALEKQGVPVERRTRPSTSVIRRLQQKSSLCLRHQNDHLHQGNRRAHRVVW